MKAMALAATVACVLLGGAARADDAMTPVHQFVDALNAGDVKKAAAAHMSSSPIIDEFAPYRWNSFGAWLKGFMADCKKNGVSDVHLTLLAPTTSTVGDKEAYEVVPNVIDAKHDGKPAQEKGVFAFALVKTAHGWRIASWSWAKQ
jgi:ketosteroid isomerase-like protein